MQAVLNDIAPHAKGSETSRESAEELIRSGRAGEAGVAVYRAIEKRGADGATCFEIEDELGMLHQTASGRITVLRKDLGVIHDTGRRRLNPKTNRNATVYRVVPRERQGKKETENNQTPEQ